MNFSPTQLRILRRAAGRQTGYICPTIEIRFGAQRMVLRALERRYLIKWSVDFNFEPVLPVISGCGRLIDIVASLGALHND